MVVFPLPARDERDWGGGGGGKRRKKKRRKMRKNEIDAGLERRAV